MTKRKKPPTKAAMIDAIVAEIMALNPLLDIARQNVRVSRQLNKVINRTHGGGYVLQSIGELVLHEKNTGVKHSHFFSRQLHDLMGVFDRSLADGVQVFTPPKVPPRTHAEEIHRVRRPFPAAAIRAMIASGLFAIEGFLVHTVTHCATGQVVASYRPDLSELRIGGRRCLRNPLVFWLFFNGHLSAAEGARLKADRTNRVLHMTPMKRGVASMMRPTTRKR